MTVAKKLDSSAPTSDILELWGAAIYVWAMFDYVSTGVFCSILGIDAVETGITLGRLEPEAKIEKCRKISLHRKKKSDAALFATIRDFAKRAKEDRNAIAHGHYLGKTERGDWLFSLPAEFIVGDGEESATEIFVIHPKEMAERIMQLQNYSSQLMESYGDARLRELQSLPVRPRSLQPKQPQNQDPKKRQRQRKPSRQSHHNK